MGASGSSGNAIGDHCTLCKTRPEYRGRLDPYDDSNHPGKYSGHWAGGAFSHVCKYGYGCRKDERERDIRAQQAIDEINAQARRKKEAQAHIRAFTNRLSGIAATHNQVELNALNQLYNDVNGAAANIRALLSNNGNQLLAAIEARRNPLQQVLTLTNRLSGIAATHNQVELNALNQLYNDVNGAAANIRALLPNNGNQLLAAIEARRNPLQQVLTLTNRLSGIAATHNQVELNTLNQLYNDVNGAAANIRALLPNNGNQLLAAIEARRNPLQQVLTLTNRLSGIAATHNQVELNALNQLYNDVNGAAANIRALLPNNGNQLLAAIEARRNPLQQVLTLTNRLSGIAATHNQVELNALNQLYNDVNGAAANIRALLPNNGNQLLAAIEARRNPLQQVLTLTNRLSGIAATQNQVELNALNQLYNDVNGAAANIRALLPNNGNQLLAAIEARRNPLQQVLTLTNRLSGIAATQNQVELNALNQLYNDVNGAAANIRALLPNNGNQLLAAIEARRNPLQQALILITENEIRNGINFDENHDHINLTFMFSASLKNITSFECDLQVAIYNSLQDVHQRIQQALSIYNQGMEHFNNGQREELAERIMNALRQYTSAGDIFAVALQEYPLNCLCTDLISLINAFIRLDDNDAAQRFIQVGIEFFPNRTGEFNSLLMHINSEDLVNSTIGDEPEEGDEQHASMAIIVAPR